MNTKVLLTLAVFTALFFAACEKNENPSKPIITILELGEGDTHGNNHIAKVGGDLHMEIDIIAEGKIDKIQVRIHPEGEHHEEGENEEGENKEWEIDTTYTKFSGLKNTTFHEHVDIDIAAEPGEYHFDFIVTDMEGNQNSAEADLQIIEN